MTKYVWRPGKWVEQARAWVCKPADYHWTPGGYLSTKGYWGRPL